MSEVPFYLTRMGARFYEHTVPELVKQITRLADALERIADTGSVDDERADEPETPDKEKP